MQLTYLHTESLNSAQIALPPPPTTIIPPSDPVPSSACRQRGRGQGLLARAPDHQSGPSCPSESSIALLAPMGLLSAVVSSSPQAVLSGSSSPHSPPCGGGLPGPLPFLGLSLSQRRANGSGLEEVDGGVDPRLPGRYLVTASHKFLFRGAKEPPPRSHPASCCSPPTLATD